MNKRDLKRLSKSQLIKLLLKKEAQKPSNGIKQMVNEPPEQFIDTYKKPIPPLRTGKWLSVKPKPVPRNSIKQMVEEKEHITDVPSSKIKELNQALKGHAKSYGIELQDNLSLLNHFTKTKALVKSHLVRRPIERHERVQIH